MDYLQFVVSFSFEKHTVENIAVISCSERHRKGAKAKYEPDHGFVQFALCGVTAIHEFPNLRLPQCTLTKCCD